MSSQINIEEVRQMINTLRESARKLKSVVDKMEDQANAVTNGALLGQAGEIFDYSLRVTLNGKIEEIVAQLLNEAEIVEHELEDNLRAQKSD